MVLLNASRLSIDRKLSNFLDKCYPNHKREGKSQARTFECAISPMKALQGIEMPISSSDISQDFESVEMLLYWQVITGFDKPDSVDVILIDYNWTQC